MTLTKQEIRTRLKHQLAIDYNCDPGDFDQEETVLTLPAANPGRRRYISGTHFLSMVTLGGNAVISADEQIHPFLKEFAAGRPGFWLFEHENLLSLEAELSRCGRHLWQTHHMFLPRTELLGWRPDFPVRWYQEGEMEAFYGDERFPNAICQPKDPGRPDTLAVAAVIGGETAGLAGCSADTETMWQIGVDVGKKYRGRGVGAMLVGLLKDESLRRGRLPFYGTSLSNLHSWNIALNCGFFPAWVEIETKEGGA